MGGRHSPEIGQVEHQLQVASGLGDPGTIGLVDHEDVGDLHEAGLVGLDAVAPSGVHDHHGGVGLAGDLHLHLPDPDGLHDDPRLPHGIEQADGLRHGQGQAAELAPGGHRPDEHPRVRGVVLHADAVAEDGAAAEGRGRVDGQHGHRQRATRRWPMSALVSVDLPAPGAPVSPTV